MKVLFIIDHIKTGGAERLLLDYYNYLKAQGHNAMIFCLNGTRSQTKWIEGIPIIYGFSDDEENLIIKAIRQFRIHFKIQKVINKFKPDIVFSFLEKSNFQTVLLSTKATKILTIHNVLSLQYTKIHNRIIKYFVYQIIHWIYSNNHHNIAVSKQVKDDLISKFKVKGTINVINNRVDRESIHLKSKLTPRCFTFQKDVKYIINIGRFSEQKAQWKLLKAFSIVKKKYTNPLELIIMGDGEYENSLKLLVNDLTIAQYVHIIPFQLNPYPYLMNADLFVLSSIYEGFPITLAEASSLRVPFIGTRKSIPEEIFENHTFWLECTIDALDTHADFSLNIHHEDEQLAKLIVRAITDEFFNENILKLSQKWESSNDKALQFHEFNRFLH